MTKKTKISLVILVGIFLVGLLLRLYRLSINLPPLYSDETSGQLWYWFQVHDRSITLFERVARIIMTSPFSLSWLFGYSTFVARLPSVINGSLLILAVYYFSSEVGKAVRLPGRRATALLTGTLVALLPWSFMLSRMYGNFAFLLILICIHISLLVSAESIKSLIISLVPLVLSTYYYPSMVIIAPLGVLIPIREIWQKLSREHRKTFSILMIIGITSLGSFLNYRYKLLNIGSRGLDLAIWRDVNTPWQMDKYRALSWNSPPSVFSFGLPPEHLANKLVYNRVMANISTFAHNYFSFFSPDWLFFKGDSILRHSTGQVGTFYPFLIPFLLYGAFVFFVTADKKTKQIVLVWILASPISAAITKDGAGYLLRVVTILPFLTYFCALGIVESFALIKKNWRVPYGALVVLIGLYSAYYFFYGYFHVYPALSARSFEYGFKELSDFQVANNHAPMLVIWDGYYHNNDFRFWQNTPFEEYGSFKTKEQVIGDTHFHQTFTNLYFVNPKSAKDVSVFLKENKIGFIVLPDRYFVNYPVELDKEFATPSAVISYPDQTPALKIFEIKGKKLNLLSLSQLL